MTDLRHLAHFVAVYRHQSFRLGARAVGVSQSTLTKNIQRLEKELGVRLFNRTTRSVAPTDTARQLIDKAESALRATDFFEAEARLLAGGDIGAIRVAAVALASETLIGATLSHLSRTHPHLEVEVVVGSSDIYQDLAAGRCDVAIGDQVNFARSVHAPVLRMVPLQKRHRESLVLVHRNGHPAGSAQALLDYPLAVPSRYFNENRLFESASAGAFRLPAPRYRLNSLSSCLNLAASSDVVTLAPRSVADRLQRAPVAGGLAIAPLDLGLNIELVFVTVANNALTPAVRAFQAALGVATQSL